ncbi:MAG TPA: alpha/beta family hydrolase [Microlunatus sp.]|nr:alpha/beta family hydrolase [Microlunatus sp.]
MTVCFEVDTPEGPGRWHVDAADEPMALLALGHGAGGGVTAMDLALLARELPGVGITVARFEQPWRLSGRKVAVPPPRLDLGWVPAIRSLVARTGTGGLPLVVGGRSAGARVACRTAEVVGAVAVLCLAFPLHLPGRPERSRLPELLQPRVPRLVLQGTRDTFGGAAELVADLAQAGGGDEVVVVPLPGADHSFKTPAGADFRPADLRARLVTSTRQLVESVASATGAGRRE